jgi:small subunit ribosomal protein S18
MAQRREKKAPPGKERRPIKKKTSILITESIDWIDYKDVNLLRRFMSERAKVRARRVTGNTQQQQVAVARAIRVAREMALLPYSVRQVTQRSKGRRDRGERGDRDRGDREGELREIPGAVDRSERARLAEAMSAEAMSAEAASAAAPSDEVTTDDLLADEVGAEIAADVEGDEE